MKQCNGCKHLVHTSGYDVCDADDGPFHSVVDPLSGRVSVVHVDPKKSLFRPRLHEMRNPGGKCGPEASLYEPTLFRRALVAIGLAT